MEIYYLTENIIIENKKLYKISKNKKHLLNINNWHKNLNLLGWEKIPLKLNNYLKKYNNNIQNLYGIIDFTYNGNCLFECICYSINSYNIYNTNYTELTSEILRNELSNSINYNKFVDIIEIYKVLKNMNEFTEDWNPYNITLNEYKEKIKDNNYWPDHILIDLLIQYLNINLIILSNIDNKYSIYNTFNIYNKNNNTIIILYEDEIHFKLIGYFNNNNIITFFDDKNIPIEIKRIININL